MSELILKGIEEAKKQLVKESEQKLMSEVGPSNMMKIYISLLRFKGIDSLPPPAFIDDWPKNFMDLNAFYMFQNLHLYYFNWCKHDSHYFRKSFS